MRCAARCSANEQGLFAGDDRDNDRRLRHPHRRAVDARRRRRLRLSANGAYLTRRRPASGIGSRLAVAARFSPRRRHRRDADPPRRQSSAHAMGAREFLRPCPGAQNGPLFREMRLATHRRARVSRPSASEDASRPFDFYPPCLPRRRPASSRCGKPPDSGRRRVRDARWWKRCAIASASTAKADIGHAAARLGLTACGAIRVGDDCAAIPEGDGHLLFASRRLHERIRRR